MGVVSKNLSFTACSAAVLLAILTTLAGAAPWDPAAQDYSGRRGVTLHVSKLGDNSDGLSWATAFTSVQLALDAIPDQQGGHRILVRPDTYMEDNLAAAHPGAEGAYNLLVGDVDGSLGSGASGRVVLDAGDPERGFKSYDWWGNIRSMTQGWSHEHTAPTFSAIVWDRWILRNLYATGGDAGLFWDCTNRIEPFTVVVEDCVSIGRAFGGGVASCLSRPDEPITFRRCTLWALDFWGDTAGAYVRVENPAMPERPDVLFEDCTLVSPECALKCGNYGFHTYMRVRLNRCRLVTLNFSQPVGTPSDGIIQSVEQGRYLHVELDDSTLMGYKVFGVKVNSDTVGDLGYTVTGSVQAYVQHTQETPPGMYRLGHWPVEVFDAIVPPAPIPARPRLEREELVTRDMCEVAPFVWEGRLCLLECVRPGSGGERADYYLIVRDVETGEEKARFGEGHGLASTMVHGGALYVFASRFENGTWNDVTQFRSEDLKFWEQRVVIEQAHGESLFNSSVCEGPDGFVMAYESNDPTYPAFTTKFARSSDLVTWTRQDDAVFGTNRYTACPCIRYEDGWYYVLYLERRAPRWYFETFIARSRDLRTWELSPANPVLAPTALEDGINASDLDLVEHDGTTYVYYAVGDQRTWMNIKRAVYPSSEKAFLESWFAEPGVPDAGDLAGYRARQAEQARTKRAHWFEEARFGLFVHWGLYAVHARNSKGPYVSWSMHDEGIPIEAYAPYADRFRPEKFDAAQWMEIARATGMRYVVFTSKHHEGFSMFDSALSDYDSMDRAAGRDFVRELVEAARNAGLRIGFYYSMLDWYHSDFRDDLPRYVDDFMFGQVRELCTNYGPIDFLWFDGEWDHPASVWRADELVAMIRELQPGALINDRLGKDERGRNKVCDFYTREQLWEIRETTHFEGARPYPWEACMTIGDSWGYREDDTKLKTSAELIRALVDVVSRGGNMLLNVGPTPDGEIPERLQERLRGIGAWIAANGESIYGTTRSPFGPLPVGKCTAKGNRLYIHLEDHPGAPVALPGLQNSIRSARFLETGEAVAFDNAAKTLSLPERLPDDAVTVIEVELDAAPVVQR